MHEIAEQHLTLNQAARISPGNVSPNCLWRWCRRGVLARSGDRVKLRHVRIGGKLFTTAGWIEEFGERLAEADAKYFELSGESDHSAAVPPSSRRRRATQSTIKAERRREHLAEVRRELDAEGL